MLPLTSPIGASFGMGGGMLMARSIDSGGAAILRPHRASSTDRYLIDAATGLALVDSGAPDWSYADLEAESVGPDGVPLVAGDAVGVPYLWDSVGEVAAPGAVVVGLPSDMRDSNLLSTSNTDYIDYFQIPSGPEWSLVLRGRQVATAGWHSLGIMGADGGSYRGLNIYSSNASKLKVWLVAATTNIGLIQLTLPNVTREVIVVVAILSGTMTARVYDANTGVLVGSGSAPTGGASSFARNLVGSGKSAISGAAQGLQRIDLFAGHALTASEADAIADGSDPTGGGTRTASYSGLRSGVYDPTDPTLLAVEAGTGAQVTL